MTAEEIWIEFAGLLRHDALGTRHVSEETASFLLPFLTGDAARERRERFLSSPVAWFDGEDKGSAVVSCPDDDYRFDFIEKNGVWELCFIECVTLPLADIKELPYRAFRPLEEKEIWIRAEKSVSQTVRLFRSLRELLGWDQAIEYFKDGKGEFLCARSWVPFYRAGKAFAAYCAWSEARIGGEEVVLEAFSDRRCVLRFVGCLWFRVYRATSHLRTMLTVEEHRRFFELIWADRANSAGWEIAFEYEGEDALLIFTQGNG